MIIKRLQGLTIAALLCSAPVAFAQNYALHLNGTTDFVASKQVAQFSNTFTIETWVNPEQPHEIDKESIVGCEGITGEHYVLYPSHGTYTWGKDNAGVGISAGTNGISVYEHSGGNIPAVLVWAGKVEGWTHVAVVYNNHVPSLYINGLLVRTGLTSTIKYVHPSTGENIVAGRNMGGIGGGTYGHFAGLVDDFRVFDTMRTEHEIQTDMSAAYTTIPHLVVNYNMNRSGVGAGLEVANSGTLKQQVFAMTKTGRPEMSVQIPAFVGATYGTQSSPQFVLRPEERNRVAGLDIASSLNSVTLEANSPNPLVRQTVIGYSIPQSGHVLLAIYDAAGHLVNTPVNSLVSAGHHEVMVNAEQFTVSGTYFYRLQFEGQAPVTRSLIVVK